MKGTPATLSWLHNAETSSFVVDLIGQLSHLESPLSRVLEWSGEIKKITEGNGHRHTEGKAMRWRSQSTSLASLHRGRLETDYRPRVVARYLSGESSRQLAAAFGVHYTTILEALELSGVPRRKCEPIPDDVAAQAVGQLYESGLSMTVIAEELGVSPPTIRRALDRAGIPPRSVGRPRTC